MKPLQKPAGFVSELGLCSLERKENKRRVYGIERRERRKERKGRGKREGRKGKIRRDGVKRAGTHSPHPSSTVPREPLRHTARTSVCNLCDRVGTPLIDKVLVTCPFERVLPLQ